MGKSKVIGYRYEIIEYEYVNMLHNDDGDKVEVCKTLHRTNSTLMYWLIILCFKIQRIKYDVIKKY